VGKHNPLVPGSTPGGPTKHPEKPLEIQGVFLLASGALAGIVAVSLVYGTVFGITVGFGSALIGEAVDYSIYYFVQSGRLGVEQWRARFWPTIRLGVLTSVCGFAALLFSGFPGLAQLGLYSLSGVLTAALVAFAAEAPVITVSFCAKLYQLSLMEDRPKPIISWVLEAV